MQKKYKTPTCVSKKTTKKNGIRFRIETLAQKKKKRIRICRSDPALVFHMAVTTITAGMKPLPARLHHVYWDCDLDNDDSELFFSARHSTVCLVIIHQ